MSKAHKPGGEGAQGLPIIPQEMTRREAADYIASLLEGLKDVAKCAGLTFIAYLLSVALEAAQEEKAKND